MIIQIFKLSTKEMWTIPNKYMLCTFIEQETGIRPNNRLTIENIVKYLPKENYNRIK